MPRKQWEDEPQGEGEEEILEDEEEEEELFDEDEDLDGEPGDELDDYSEDDELDEDEEEDDDEDEEGEDDDEAEDEEEEEDTFPIACPYCGQRDMLYVDPDQEVGSTYTEECNYCAHSMRVTVVGRRGRRGVVVDRA